MTNKLTSKHFCYAKKIGIQIFQDAPDIGTEALWLEALFGINQSRPLPEFLSDLLDSREKAQPNRLISIDVPAGICSDSGKLISRKAAIASYNLSIAGYRLTCHVKLSCI